MCVFECVRVCADVVSAALHAPSLLDTARTVGHARPRYNLTANRGYAAACRYLNVDTAVSGDTFGAAASPSAVGAVVKAVTDLRSIPPITSASVGPLGGGSDYAPFLNHLGIASVDFGFRDPEGYPVYHSV